jgi:magnesium transporter
VGSIYGMNFDHMPELHWLYGYPFALALMLLSSLIVFIVSRRAGWL